jgi:hypothetical protein
MSKTALGRDRQIDRQPARDRLAVLVIIAGILYVCVYPQKHTTYTVILLFYCPYLPAQFMHFSTVHISRNYSCL